MLETNWKSIPMGKPAKPMFGHQDANLNSIHLVLATIIRERWQARSHFTSNGVFTKITSNPWAPWLTNQETSIQARKALLFLIILLESRNYTAWQRRRTFETCSSCKSRAIQTKFGKMYQLRSITVWQESKPGIITGSLLEFWTISSDTNTIGNTSHLT